jgi:hypothetical protein
VSQALLCFDGPEYSPKHDRARLTLQLEKIRVLMLDGQWRTIREVSRLTGAPEASASAQLRNLRKEPHAYEVQRRARGDRSDGLFEYRLVVGAAVQP